MQTKSLGYRRLDCLLELFNEEDKEYRLKGSDIALYSLLKRFKGELFELDDYFHKSFRQCNVCDLKEGNGEIDRAVWHLIDISEIFLKLYDKTIEKIKE